MDTKELIEHTKRLTSIVEKAGENVHQLNGASAQVVEFLKRYAGDKSSFLSSVTNLYHGSWTPKYKVLSIISTLNSFVEYVESGLLEGISPERKAQLDVVSDFLEQADNLLQTKGIHPAAPAVIIGATLEEFLRTWIEAENLSLGSKKPSLENYSQTLREADFITKQDAKDLTSWGGIRNHAAHGEWDEVADKKRISLMLEGVNLFMRKYGAGSSC
jgi:hypothetical protein